MDTEDPIDRPSKKLNVDTEDQLHTSEEVKVEINDQIIKTDGFSNLPDHIIHHILSLINTKDAVRTSVLSKRWRYHWTNIHNLNFSRHSFNSWFFYYSFVNHVLRHRNHSKLHKLNFRCKGEVVGFYEGSTCRDQIKRIVFEYVKSHGVDEIESNMIDGGFSPDPILCQTLKTLKLHSPTRQSFERLKDLSSFTRLTTLQLSSVYFKSNNDIFSNCLNLENLILIKCGRLWKRANFFTLSASRLLNLQILDSKFDVKKIVINAPALKFLYFDAVEPLVLNIDKCLTLDHVNIHIIPKEILEAYSEMERMTLNGQHHMDIVPRYIVNTSSCQESMLKEFMKRMILMCQHLSHTKSLGFTLNLPKEKLTLNNSVVTGAKVVRLDKNTGEEHLLFASPVSGGFDIYQLGTIMEETISEKLSNLSLERGRTLLIGLAVMGDFFIKQVLPSNKDYCPSESDEDSSSDTL